MPDCLYPPHSAAGLYGPKSLTQIVPWRSALATRAALSASFDHSPPESPNGVSLAMAIASFSLSKTSTVMTGPKDSS